MTYGALSTKEPHLWMRSLAGPVSGSMFTESMVNSDRPRLAQLFFRMASSASNKYMTETIISQEAEILSRIIAPDNPSFSAEGARSILELGFSEDDGERMKALAAKARQGSLNEQEESLLNAYLFLGSLVDVMHSKARLSLKKQSA